MSPNYRTDGDSDQDVRPMDRTAKTPVAKTLRNSSRSEARLLALSVGAQFAQSMASEIFKQAIVANAAGLAAVLAYLANRKVVDAVPLIWSAGFFLAGVAAALLACLFTYTQTNSVFKCMMTASAKGEGFSMSRWQIVLGRLAVGLCWAAVTAFVLGGIFAAFGLYNPIITMQASDL